VTYVVIFQIITLPVLVVGLIALVLRAVQQAAQARVRAYELGVLRAVANDELTAESARELLATVDEFRAVQGQMTVPRGAVAAWIMRNVDNGDINHLDRARMHARDADELAVINSLQRDMTAGIVAAAFSSSLPSVLSVYPLALFVIARRLRLRTPLGKPIQDVLVREVRATEKVQRRRDDVAIAS